MFLFWRDRLGYTFAFFFNVMVILLLFYLIEPKWVMEQIPYVFLLSLTIYLIVLSISFIRWYPMMKLIERKLAQNHLDAFSSIEQPGTLEQRFYAESFHRLYRLAMEEQQKINRVHQEHREFIELWVHQMKLPVSTLSLVVQQIQPRNVEEKEQLYSMMEEIDKLNQGLDHALSMARLTDFSLDYHIRPVSILEQVQEVITSRKKAMIRSAIVPQVVAEQGEWIVLTDPKWHRFVLEQIVQNALKYTRQVKKGSKLLFQLKRQKKQIQLSIQDQGPGIPPEDLPRVFDPFFTGQNGRKFAEATGMGLYLAKKVCDQLDHLLSIDSTVGQGTTVTITYHAMDQEHERKFHR